MLPCSVRLARRGRPVFLQCTFNCRFSPVVSPASTSNKQFQPQPLMPSVAVFSSCWLNTGTCFACEKPSHWHSCYPAMAKQASRAPNWLDEGPQSAAVCFNFLCRNLIFETECRNVNQEHLNVSSFFRRHAVSFGLIQGLWEPVDFSILHCTFSSGRGFLVYQFVAYFVSFMFILNVISQGYKIPFFQLPKPFLQSLLCLQQLTVLFYPKLLIGSSVLTSSQKGFTFLTLFTHLFSSTLVNIGLSQILGTFTLSFVDKKI